MADLDLLNGRPPKCNWCSKTPLLSWWGGVPDIGVLCPECYAKWKEQQPKRTFK